MWQYMIYNGLPDATEFNQFGQDGWELVAVYGDTHYFKKAA